jgi:hypothetical protein
MALNKWELRPEREDRVLTTTKITTDGGSLAGFAKTVKKMEEMGIPLEEASVFYDEGAQEFTVSYLRPASDEEHKHRLEEFEENISRRTVALRNNIEYYQKVVEDLKDKLEEITEKYVLNKLK